MLPDKGQPPPSPPATVLVVDDNRDVVDILTHLLSRHSPIAQGAYSGR